MDDFTALLAQTLRARPGLTKEKLAAAMNLENTEDFREKLSAACDQDLAHKIADKYYPGVRLAY
jgi:hypothetical protein